MYKLQIKLCVLALTTGEKKLGGTDVIFVA